jgi:septum formation protein
MKIYLASKSPRRSELLQQMGVDFDILSLEVPEEKIHSETAENYSLRITTEKLNEAWNNLIKNKLPIRPVLCADTEVILDQKILGKPKNKNQAFSMLKNLSGRQHEVLTSVGLRYLTHQKIVLNRTIVYFSPISDEEIHWYLATDDYKDKAGSYGIQSAIGQFIYKIEGCFYSVMGLPLNTVRELLAEIKPILIQ